MFPLPASVDNFFTGDLFVCLSMENSVKSSKVPLHFVVIVIDSYIELHDYFTFVNSALSVLSGNLNWEMGRNQKKIIYLLVYSIKLN